MWRTWTSLEVKTPGRSIHEAIQCFKPHSAPQCACLKHSILICASEIKPIIHKTVCKSQRTNIYIFVCISIIASVAFYLNIAVYILNPTQGFPTLRPSIPTPSSLPLPSLLFFLFSAPPLHPFPPTPPTIYWVLLHCGDSSDAASVCNIISNLYIT